MFFKRGKLAKLHYGLALESNWQNRLLDWSQRKPASPTVQTAPLSGQAECTATPPDYFMTVSGFSSTDTVVIKSFIN